MTVRSPLWDGIAIGIGFLIILTGTGGVALVLAAIGTVTKDEVRPVLVVRAWVVAREAVAVAWIRAHRWPLAGLLWGARGAHKLGRRLAEAATQDDYVAAQDRGDRGLDGSPADDLTADDEFDTDTLRIFHEANEENLVPTHEPDVPRQDVTGDRPDNAAGRQHDGPPHASNPGEASLPDGAPADPPENVPAHTGCGPGAEDPGPDVPPPHDDAPASEVTPSGPGDQPSDPSGPAVERTACDATPDQAGPEAAEDPPGPVEVRAPGPGSSGPGAPAAQQPSSESGEPGAQAAACHPFRRLPAADLDPLTWTIARHLDAPVEMLAEWESQIAEHIAEAMTRLRAVAA